MTERRKQVAQSVERRTLDVEVRESKPALGTGGGGVGSNLTSPIRRNARAMYDRDLGNWHWQLTGSGLPNLGNRKKWNRQLISTTFWITDLWKWKSGRFVCIQTKNTNTLPPEKKYKKQTSPPPPPPTTTKNKQQTLTERLTPRFAEWDSSTLTLDLMSGLWTALDFWLLFSHSNSHFG